MVCGLSFFVQESRAEEAPKKVSPIGGDIALSEFTNTPSLIYSDFSLSEDPITVLDPDAFELSFPKLYEGEFAYAGFSWGYFDESNGSEFVGNAEVVDEFLTLQLISDLGNEKLKVEIVDTAGEKVSYYANGLENFWQTYQFDVSKLNGSLASVLFVYAAPYDKDVKSAQVQVKAAHIGLTVDAYPNSNDPLPVLTEFENTPSLALSDTLSQGDIAVSDPDAFELSLPMLSAGDFVYAGLSWGYVHPDTNIFVGNPEPNTGSLALELETASGLGDNELKVEITDTVGNKVFYTILGMSASAQTYLFNTSTLPGSLASVLFVYDTPGQSSRSVAVRAGKIGLTVNVSPNNGGALTQFSITPSLALSDALSQSDVAVSDPDAFEVSLPMLSAGDFVYAGLSWGYFHPDTNIFVGNPEPNPGSLALELETASGLGDNELKVEITDTAGNKLFYTILGLSASAQTYLLNTSTLPGSLASILFVYDTPDQNEKSVRINAGRMGLAVDISPDTSNPALTDFSITPTIALSDLLSKGAVAVSDPDAFQVSLPNLDSGDFVYAGLSWGYFDPDTEIFVGNPEPNTGSLVLELNALDLADRALKVEITDTAGEIVAYYIRGLAADLKTYRFDLSMLASHLASVLFVYDTADQGEKSVSVRAGQMALAVDVAPLNNGTNPDPTALSVRPSLAFGGVLTRDSFDVPNNDGLFTNIGIAELTRDLIAVPHQDRFQIALPELLEAEFIFAGISWGYFDPDTDTFVGTGEPIDSQTPPLLLELKASDLVASNLPDIVDRELKVEFTDSTGVTVPYYIRGLSTDWQTYSFDLSPLQDKLISVLFVYDTLGEPAKNLSIRATSIGLPVDVPASPYAQNQWSSIPNSTALVEGSETVFEGESFEGTFAVTATSIQAFDIDYAEIDDGEFGWAALSRGYFDDLTGEFVGKAWQLNDASLTLAVRNGRAGDRLKVEFVDLNNNLYMVNLVLTDNEQNYTIDLSESGLDLGFDPTGTLSSSEPSGGLAYINFVFDLFYTGTEGNVTVEMLNVPYVHPAKIQPYAYDEHSTFTEMPITFAPFGNTTGGTIDLVHTYSNKFYYDYSIDPDGFVFCQIKWGDFMSNGTYSGDTQDFSVNNMIVFGINGPPGDIKIEVSDDQAAKAFFAVTLTGGPQNICLDLSPFAGKVDLSKIISITFVGDSGSAAEQGVVGVKTRGLDYLPPYSTAYKHLIGVQQTIELTDGTWQRIVYDQMIVDPVVFLDAPASLGVEYEVLNNHDLTEAETEQGIQGIRIRATNQAELPGEVTCTILESGIYTTRSNGAVEVTYDSDGNPMGDTILSSLRDSEGNAVGNGEVFLPSQWDEWFEANVESFSLYDLTEAKTEQGILIELNIAANERFPVVYVQSQVLLNGEWVDAGRSICSKTDRGYIYINPAYLKVGTNDIALHVQDRLGRPLGVDIEYNWTAQPLTTVWKMGQNDQSDGDFQQSNYTADAVTFTSSGVRMNEFPKEIGGPTRPIQLIDFYLTNAQVQRPKELNFDVATSNGAGTLPLRLDYYNHDKQEWMPVDEFEVSQYAPAVVELALHELYEGLNQLRLEVVGSSDVTGVVTWDKVGLYERLEKPQVARDFLLKVMSNSLNYFLDDSVAMHKTALPMTAVKTGKVLNRERFGWSNPTEWGLGMQSWIAAYEMSRLAEGVQSKLTEAQILDMIERSLTEMERIQATDEDYKVDLFYPAYRMTVKQQGDTQGDDLEQIVKDGVNDKLPIGDVALHWASVNVVHGWMIDLQSNKQADSDDFNKIQGLIDLAIRVKDRMKFAAGYFYDPGPEDEGYYIAHVLDGAEFIDDPNNPGGQMPNPRFGLPAIPDNAEDAKPTVWNVWSDEGGVVNIICSVTNSITAEEFANVLDSQLKNERTWQGITIKDAAFFNAAFTWAQRTMLGFPIFGNLEERQYDLAERQYGVYSFLPAARSHLVYADYIADEKTAKIDYPAFSDAMTQSDDRQPTTFKGLIGRWTPVVDEENYFLAQNRDPDFAMPLHTQPHALFVWLGAFPYMEQSLFYRYFEAGMELMYDAKGYWHGEDDPYPYGFEVVASPFIDDLTYQGANDGRDIFEALSVGYTVLPLYDGLARVSSGRTFDYFRSKVDADVNETLKQVTILAYQGRESGIAPEEPQWPPSVSGTSDSDADGLPDDLEPYFARDPNVADGPWYDALFIDESFLTLQYQRPADRHPADEILFEVTSTLEDPSSWSSEGIVETVIAEGDPHTLQIQVPINNRTKLFVRVRMRITE